jgi:predicted dehydrogenase
MQDLTLFGADFQLSLSAIPPRVTGRIGGGSVKTEAVDKTFPQGPGMGRSGQVHPSRKPEDPPDPPHHDEMKVFLDAVRTGATAQIRSPFADAAQTVAVVDAVMRSVQTGQVVKVESVA